MSAHLKMPVQRTADGLRYERYLKALTDIATGKRADKDMLQELEQANLALKDLSPGDVHVDSVMANMSVMYVNDDFIGLRLMPQVFTSGKLSGTYFTYGKRDRLGYPDDSMSARTKANETNQTRGTATYSLQPRALREFVDQLTLNNQDAPLNELVDALSNVLEGLAFNREVRIADIVSTGGNYGGNTVAIAAPNRWDKPGSDPLSDVDSAQANMWDGSGQSRKVMVVSLNVHNVLKKHPNVLDSIKYSGNKPASASREDLAAYFEVDEYLVGRSRKDTANDGQAASYTRIWPDVCAILRVAVRPSVRQAVFGYTFQDAPTTSDQTFDIQEGTKGGWWNRASHCDDQNVVAPTTGFLITTPIG